jgi:hypothetical protein
MGPGSPPGTSLSKRKNLRERLAGHLSDVDKVVVFLWLLIVVGLISLVVPACVQLTHGNWAGALTVVGTGLFLAGASALVGSIIGFLFGVPVRERNPGVDATGTVNRTIGYRPNTNLEQISDWLTKIIVGIGLVQFPKIAHFFVLLGHYAGPAFGAAPAGEIIAVSIVIHYTLVGFFNGFLLAYLWLPGAFNRAMEVRGSSAAEAAEANAEAITRYEQVLADRERVLGADHPGTLATRDNLAAAYRGAGRTAEAIAQYEQVLAGRERVLGADHPDTLATLNNLATAYRETGRTAEKIEPQASDP